MNQKKGLTLPLVAGLIFPVMLLVILAFVIPWVIFFFPFQLVIGQACFCLLSITLNQKTGWWKTASIGVRAPPFDF